MATDRAPAIPSKGTGQYTRQGHTDAGVFGSSPTVTPMGKVADSPRELKPNS